MLEIVIFFAGNAALVAVFTFGPVGRWMKKLPKDRV